MEARREPDNSTARLRIALRQLRAEFGIDYAKLAKAGATVMVVLDGAELRMLRQALRLTVTQCARWAGVSLSVWHDWERNVAKRTTQQQALDRVCQLIIRARELEIFALLEHGAVPESRPVQEADRRKLLYRCTQCGRELVMGAIEERSEALDGRDVVILEHDGGCGPVQWAPNPRYPVRDRLRPGRRMTSVGH